MKLIIQAIALSGFALLVSCGNNKSETTDTTITDTSAATTVTTDNTGVVTVEAPPTAKTAFEAKYPQASNVRWQYHRPDVTSIDWDWSGWPSVDTTDYVASFNWDGHDYWAWYDQDGNWVGSVNKISDHNNLPTAVSDVIKNQYNGYTIVSVDRENDKNRSAYEIQLESGDNKTKILVDENGKVMKKKEITGDTKTKTKEQ